MRWLLLLILTGCTATLSIKPFTEQHRPVSHSPHKHTKKKVSPKPVPLPPDPRFHDITEVLKTSASNQ